MMETFLFACGVHPTLELEIEAAGSAHSTRFCLHQPFAIVGRHPAADIYLDADGVRPRHLYFQAIEGRIVCVNVSQTGSFATDEKEISTHCWLNANQTIHLGSRKIKLLEQEEENTEGEKVNDPLAPGSAWEIFAPRITLEITNDEAPLTKKTWLVDRVLTLVGRTPRCALQFLEEGISNVHCSLVLTTAGLWVVDLLGRGGIVINEMPVRVGRLGMEDELRLGPYHIRLQEIPETIALPKDEKEYRELTEAEEFDMTTPATRPDSANQTRNYQTPWPEDVEQAKVLETLMDQFQNMKGPMFAQHQHMLSRMIETYAHLKGDQQEAVKNELDRLCRISKEVESIQKTTETKDTGATDGLPASQTLAPTMEQPNMPTNEEPARPLPPVNEPPKPRTRSASSLLKDADSSVFRMPIKTGELYENASSEFPPIPDSISNPWQYRETETHTDDLSHNAGYDPNQHDTGLQPFTPPPSILNETDQAARDRMKALQSEQSSIWKKMSGFFFKKSSK